ncbi:MAG: hypothetical protein HY331_15325 [Chloroflexi bacterium]|nr:hypothetical protein [Chloroflexota bacterium]
MSKNGTFFVSVVESSQIAPSVWDPYHYRYDAARETLSQYAVVMKLGSGYEILLYRSLFHPIEYRHIPGGRYLSFFLEPSLGAQQAAYPTIGEQQLLFGTMRAYLGNVVVTPKAEWIGLEGPLFLPVKSEFVRVAPHDNCTYFWWAYLQSEAFLRNLPLGSGGTRPRLHKEALLRTPVRVPELERRRAIHDQLLECAEWEWKVYHARTRVLSSVDFGAS